MSIQACHRSTFTWPSISGTTLVALSTNVVNDTAPTVYYPGTYTSPAVPLNQSLAYCNVSLTYSHPGYRDAVNTYVLLPFADEWNGRLQGCAGGGFVTGNNPRLVNAALGEGYAAVTTDGGHAGGDYDTGLNVLFDWAILSPGNSNLPLIENFATTAVRDTATIGKAIATSFYGTPPKKAYWNGCSQGGRQGHMLAQRYPDAYDGILGASPAINWAEFFPNVLWPAAVMNSIHYYPSPCEMDAITAAAVKACDGLDGVKDGVISRNDLCDFNADTVVGQEVHCDASGALFVGGVDAAKNTTTTIYKAKISSGAATVMNMAWQGSTSAKGEFEWYGFTRGTSLSAVGGTTCTLLDPEPQSNSNSNSPFNCSLVAFPLAENWIKGFIYAVPTDNLNTTAPSGPVAPWSFNTNITTRGEYDEIFRLSQVTFNNWLETTATNLDDFRQSGGKLLTWHGGNDQIIVPNGTVDYYESVLARDRSIRVQTSDYYRFFEAPGLPHCTVGPGPLPRNVLDTLVKWVEEGQPPDTLSAETEPDETGRTWKRPLCLYPKHQVWTGTGDPHDVGGWSCQ